MTGPAKRIFEGRHLRCPAFVAGAQLYPKFDNFVGMKAEFSAPKSSRKALAAGFRHLVIQTTANDWYLNAELDDSPGVLRQEVGTAETSRSLGLSMGVFGALLFAEALGTRDLILVSPRLPRPMGWIGRAGINRAGINRAKALLSRFWPERINAATAHPVRTLLLYDPQKFDDRMAARWLEDTGLQVRTLGVAFGGHPCVSFITDANGFGALQDILLRP